MDARPRCATGRTRGTVAAAPRKLRSAIRDSPETRSQIVLVRLLTDVVTVRDALLWVTDWPIYSSAEVSLWNQVRTRLGESRRLIEAPGQLFEEQVARHSLAVLMLLMAAFNWEGYFLQGDVTSMTWLADEVAEVWAETERPQLPRQLASIGVTAEAIHRR